MKFTNYKKVLITGAEGMVGKALQNVLPNSKYNIIPLPSSKNLDLRNRDKVFYCFDFYRPHYVVHLAARVGGVKANTDYPSDFYMDNIKMNTNVLEASLYYRVEKVLSFLSTCIYPDNATYPLTEDQIHNGPPHPSNYTYAYTKRMLDIQSRAFNEQYGGKKFVSIVPNNIYGKYDMFHLDNAHVIPAMIRKFHEANLNNTDVMLWGDGNQLREFTYSDDIAKIIKMSLEKYDDLEPMNVGDPNQYEIKFIAQEISKIMNFNGNIIWDTSKPKGQFKKPSSHEKFEKFLKQNNQSFDFIKIQEGLKETCDWFVKTYPNIRGI